MENESNEATLCVQRATLLLLPLTRTRRSLAQVRGADVIVLTYAADDDESLARVRTHWLPELRAAGAAVPVVLVGCRLDLRNGLGRDTTVMDIIQPKGVCQKSKR